MPRFKLVPILNADAVPGLCSTTLKRKYDISAILQAQDDLRKYRENKIDVDSIEIYEYVNREPKLRAIVL
jgi:hypothetical protein